MDINETLMKKYNIIVADPPWKFGQKQTKTSLRVEQHYKTMSLKELYAFDLIKIIAAKNCALYIWAPDCFIKDAIAIGESYGFQYKTIAFIWTKLRGIKLNLCKNPTPYGLKSHEICILLTKGKIRQHIVKFNILQDFQSIRGKHSEKPKYVLDTIHEMFPNVPKIEIFARIKHEHFDAYGEHYET